MTRAPLRRLLATAAAALAALAAAPAALALAPAPDPFVAWPVCAAPEDAYCIESATVDGVDALAGDGASVDGHALQVEASLLDAHSVNWAVHWAGGGAQRSLPASLLGADIRVVLRTGALVPRFTQALADGFFLTAAGDDASGHVLTLEGSPATENWLEDTSVSNCFAGACGDETTQADTAFESFSGNTQDMSTWDPGERAALDGMYIATNAQYQPPLVLFGTFPQPYWQLALGNPHLALDGTAATGSFSAWLPPAFFAAASTTPEVAAATGFAVTRTDGGTTTDVEAAASLVDGGVYIRVPSLHYSTPTLHGEIGASGAPQPIAPDAPTLVQAVAGHAAATLGFRAPRFDGGATLAGYVAACSQAGVPHVATAVAGASTVVVHGLTPGVAASCTVTATNAHGTSVPSRSRAVTPLAPVAPGAPRIASVRPVTAGLDLVVAAAADDGGARLVRVDVTCTQPGRVRAARAAAPGAVRVGGLYTRVPATCRAVATSAAGSSAASAVAFAAPAFTGSGPVTGYRVRLCRARGACTDATAVVAATAAARSVVLRLPRRMAAGAYVVAAAALNRAGAGAAATLPLRLG